MGSTTCKAERNHVGHRFDSGRLHQEYEKGGCATQGDEDAWYYGPWGPSCPEIDKWISGVVAILLIVGLYYLI